ncbi:hypothetical protein M0805_006717 [Coniferiporia weirii]|nr:hypothetical protein M0805_006717 [Coniferiporia weirii]
MPFLGHDDLVCQLRTILPAASPSFIIIKDSCATGRTGAVLRDVLTSLAEDVSESTKLAFAVVNCVACFTQRLLFDTILDALAVSCVSRSDRREAIEALASPRNDNLDGFLHCLRAIFSAAEGTSVNSTSANNDSLSKLVLVFERAERLRESLPKLTIPLTRLQELTGKDVTTVFLTDVEWEYISPFPGSLTDPYRITIKPPEKQGIIDWICSTFPEDEQLEPINPYNPSLRPLFYHFVETIYNVCAPFTTDPRELEYITSARWPGFVSPVLEDWKEQAGGPYFGPSEEDRIRLIRLFSPSLTHAVENLYPRSVGSLEWSTANFPQGKALSQLLGRYSLPPATLSSGSQVTTLELSNMSMFILLAAFLASYNPAKTDYRLLGRGGSEGSRRKRKGGGTRKSKAGSTTKLPQRLIGPMSFPYDRLVAILGSLLQEYDELKQTGKPLEDNASLKAETDVYRVQTSSTVRELVSLRLLHRGTVHDKLDTPVFKCGIGYDQALSLARKLSIPLNELLWEPS